MFYLKDRVSCQGVTAGLGRHLDWLKRDRNVDDRRSSSVNKHTEMGGRVGVSS